MTEIQAFAVVILPFVVVGGAFMMLFIHQMNTPSIGDGPPKDASGSVKIEVVKTSWGPVLGLLLLAAVFGFLFLGDQSGRLFGWLQH
jgi:hypothetical protein